MLKLSRNRRKDLTAYGVFVALAAFGLSGWFITSGSDGVSGTPAMVVTALSIFYIVWVFTSAMLKWWWGGFAYVGICVVAVCLAVYGAGSVDGQASGVSVVHYIPAGPDTAPLHSVECTPVLGVDIQEGTVICTP